MHDAITRSTFAYATFLFVVLFGPQVVAEHHTGMGQLISMFPDWISLFGTLVVLYVAVRHAMAGHADGRFKRGFARGVAVSVIGGVLYGIGIAVIAPGIFANREFAWGVALLSPLVVAVIGSALSALFAYLAARGRREERESRVNGESWLADVTARFRELKSQCDRALAQVPIERWGYRIDPQANSIVTLMLHLSGNMRSRWTDFLSRDGEKPDRDRDAEFEDAALGREELLARWEAGWACLFGALEGLADADLERDVLIRAQPHKVYAAIDRQLAHYAVHTGQLVLLAKHLAGPAWATLSVPRGGSGAFNASLMGTPPERPRG